MLMCLIFIYHYNSLTSENFDPILQMAGEGKKQLNINNQAGVMQYSTCADKLLLPLGARVFGGTTVCSP